MTTGYSYTRFSTPAQMKGDSLRRQVARADRFAAEKKLQLDTTLRDLGVSGYSGRHRKKGALASFLDKVKAGDIVPGSWLIVENIDRLSRENPWDAQGMFREIIEAGLIVASLADDMIYDRAKLRQRPEMMQTLLAALTKSHRESADKADRLQEAWAAKRADISAGGRKKLTRQGPGWLTLIADDPSDPLVGDWVINGNGATVELAFELCLTGLGKELIARRLNSENRRPFKSGDGWQPSTVGLLLADRRTIGEFQMHRKIDGRRIPVGEPIKGYFPAVISDEVFYRAQAEIAKRHCGARPGKKGKVPNLFVGLAHCSCGRRMEYRDKQKHFGPPGKAVYLICSGAQRGHACNNNRHFPYAEFEGRILDWVSDIKVSDEEATGATIAAIKLDAKQAELANLGRRIEEALEKWQDESDPSLKSVLYASAQRNGEAKRRVEAEVEELEDVVRSTKRSVLEESRARVGRLRFQMEGLEGTELFDARARLASAMRAVIDHFEFQEGGGVSAVVKGGAKLYHFGVGVKVEIFDLHGFDAKDEQDIQFSTLDMKREADWNRLEMSEMDVAATICSTKWLYGAATTKSPTVGGDAHAVKERSDGQAQTG